MVWFILAAVALAALGLWLVPGGWVVGPVGWSLSPSVTVTEHPRGIGTPRASQVAQRGRQGPGMDYPQARTGAGVEAGAAISYRPVGYRRVSYR